MGIPEFSIQELVARIGRGEIRLPEMQRAYVWSSAKVCDLLDSLYRGYPSGTILTWETNEYVVTRDPAIPQNKSSKQSFQLLLDGQQRLTSLSAVIRGEPIVLGGQKKPIEVMFNLDHPDEPIFITEEYENDSTDATAEEKKQRKQERLKRMTFAVKTKQLEKMPYWVSVTEAFKIKGTGKFLEKAGVTMDNPLYKEYESRLGNLLNIKNYLYGMQVLDRSKSYEEVTDIFVRVNSAGTKLKNTDLALAQITAKWTGSLEIFEAFKDKCKNANFDLELGVFIKNLIAFATGKSTFKAVSGLSRERLETVWEESKEGFEYAINFLESNIGINNSALLSSPTILISVAYFRHYNKDNLSSEDKKKLRYWVLAANLHGRYSRASSETALVQDLREIRNGKGLDGMIGLLRNHFGRLEIEAESLENKSSGSSYFKTMFLAFSKDGAGDWNTGLGTSFNHLGDQHKLQFHHIFPQSLFEYRVKDKQKINDICNLAFIGGRTNRKINNEHPSVYLSKIVKSQTEEALVAQQIPIDESLWELDRYDDFLKARRNSVVKKLNDFLGHDKIKPKGTN